MQDRIEKDEKKGLRKKKKILVQVGIVIALVFSVLTVFAVLSLRRAVRESYITGKEEMLDDEILNLAEATLDFKSVGWGLTYCRNHIDEMKARMLTDMEKADFLSKDNTMDFGSDLQRSIYVGSCIPSEEELEKASPEKQLLYAKLIYHYFILNIRGIQEDLRSSRFGDVYFVMDIQPETLGLLYYIGDKEKDLYTEYMEFGMYRRDLIPSDELLGYLRNPNKEGGSNLYERRVAEDGRQLLVGYIPIIETTENGEPHVIAIAGVIHDWTAYYESMHKAVLRKMINHVVLMVLAGGVLVLVLYSIVLKPLKRVQVGVREYTENKDRNMVEANMQKVVQQNEVGQLADDVVHLADELERYTEENVRIAAERERMGTEVVLAMRFQEEMLPREVPENPHFELYATTIPAKEVGGDFYDYFMLDETHLAFLVADVSDKGMSSAFFMAVSKTLINFRAQQGGDPAEVLTTVDKWLEENNALGQFVTVWMGILDLESGELSVCNAGHDYPALALNGGDFVIEKTEHGHPIAFLPGMAMEQKGYTVQMKPGDRIFLYTDGVLDEQRSDGERFEKQRLVEVLNANRDLDCKDLIRKVQTAVLDFGGTEGQFDDITMLELIYKG